MLDLAAWHADPLSEDEAKARLAALTGATAWAARLETLRLRLMLGLPASMQRDVLLAEAWDERARAAIELITGQVMLARRLQGAWDWLDQAQRRLAHHLSGPDYLKLLQRHARLRPLPLFTHPKALRPLPELLAIATAVARLEAQKRPALRTDSRDTLG